jgi:hypothetical protein
MADTKISAATSTTLPLSTDMLPFARSGDTTARKITVGNFLANIPSQIGVAVGQDALSLTQAGNYRDEIAFKTAGSDYVNGTWRQFVTDGGDGRHDHILSLAYNLRRNNATLTWERDIDGEHVAYWGFESRYNLTPNLLRGASEVNWNVDAAITGAIAMHRPFGMYYTMDAPVHVQIDLGDVGDTGNIINAFGFLNVNNNRTGSDRAAVFVARSEVGNAIGSVIDLYEDTSDTPAVGLGAGIRFNAETSTTEDVVQGVIGFAWQTVTHASRTAEIVFKQTINAVLTETMRLKSNKGLNVAGYIAASGDGASAQGYYGGASNDVQLYRDTGPIWRTPQGVRADGGIQVGTISVLASAGQVHASNNIWSDGGFYAGAAGEGSLGWDGLGWSTPQGMKISGFLKHAGTMLGFYNHAAVVQPAAPVTLDDVIAIIRGCGLSA